MAFDKAKYWENRKAGKCGQGENPKSKVKPNLGSNRKQYRRTARAIFYGLIRNARGILKEHTEGRPFTGKGVSHKYFKQEFTPSQDPNVSNHDRVVAQRSRRKVK